MINTMNIQMKTANEMTAGPSIRGEAKPIAQKVMKRSTAGTVSIWSSTFNAY